jgi:polyisoprenyl-teichoic acid--peptidoglycan teichoic acid transferase
MATSNSSTDKTTDIEAEIIQPDGNEALELKKAGRTKILKSRLKRKVFKHVWVVRGVIVVGTLLLLYAVFRNLFAGFLETGIGHTFTLGKVFVVANPNEIDSISGKTNLLVLGKSGAGHDSPDLTDTIIFLSVDRIHNKVSMISIPRDIWMPSIRAKINSAYYWGNQKEESGGFVLAKSAVEEVVGQPINYVVVFDFSGFVETVNALGGIEVDVENTFTDERYPVAGKENDLCGGDPEFACRYETIRFTRGKQMMDGERALKFVRSRNAEGDEGTDFARARRQARVFGAVKSKLLSREILLSPRKLSEVVKVIERNSETNLNDREAAVLMRFFFNAKGNLNTDVIPENLLVNPPTSPRYDNLYVFIPSGDDPDTPQHEWGEVHEWVKSVLD